MEEKFWDERYSAPHYVYGTEPNEYFKEELQKLTAGKLLLPGEGEGRNAVYAAKNGWIVFANDFSIQAREKALKLAKENGVEINYEVFPADEAEYPENEFDAAALIFVHFPPTKRKKVHKAVIRSLKPGGVLIIEAFSKKQIKNSSGGPKDEEALYMLEDFQEDFEALRTELLKEKHIELREGAFHTGPADVIRFRAFKTE